MKLLMAGVLFFALAGTSLGAAIENCHMERLVACGDPLADFRKEMGQSFPTTEEQAKELCKRMEEGKKCAEEYQNKCMTPLQLETMGFLAEGSLQAYKEFCTEGSQIREDYLKNAKCMDESSKSEEAKEHFTYVEAALEDIAEKEPLKRLPIACCGYQWLTAKSDKMGRERCGQEAVDSFRKVVEMAVSTVPDVLCSGFEPDGDICKDVLPPLGTQPKGTLKNSHLAQTFMSMYLPDVQV